MAIWRYNPGSPKLREKTRVKNLNYKPHHRSLGGGASKEKKEIVIMATMTLKETQAGTMKATMEDILLSISWADLSKTYFGKSNSWLYHKLDGVDGNKKPTDFTEEEKYTLKGALIDLSERIRRAADRIQ